MHYKHLFWNHFFSRRGSPSQRIMPNDVRRLHTALQSCDGIWTTHWKNTTVGKSVHSDTTGQWKQTRPLFQSTGLQCPQEDKIVTNCNFSFSCAWTPFSKSARSPRQNSGIERREIISRTWRKKILDEEKFYGHEENKSNRVNLFRAIVEFRCNTAT
jgi:hypothetical protein